MTSAELQKNIDITTKIVEEAIAAERKRCAELAAEVCWQRLRHGGAQDEGVFAEAVRRAILEGGL